MKVGILGSGLCGLSAALELCGRCEVVVFEKNTFAGGCMSSKKYGQYELETLYHHCFSKDTELFRLLDNLNLGNELVWLKGSTGYYAKGRLESVTTPAEILKWSALSFMQKARLGFFVLSARSIDEDALDKITAKEYLLEKVGENIYRAFFEPLLIGKFGERKDEVSAAWLMSRIAIRSDRGAEGERLGYMKGGWHRLIDAMCDKIREKGGEIRLNTAVTSLEKQEKWLINGEEFDAVISTLPPQNTKALLKNPENFNLPDMMYQGAACMTLGVKKNPTPGIYWTNMGERTAFGAVVVHTNFAPFEWYGEHVVYLASYFKDEPAKDLESRMIDDFCSKFGMDKSDILHQDMYIDKFAGPVFVTGYKEHIPDICAGNGLYIAGMFSEENYPERSMEGSIKAGIRAAKQIQ
ncbi:MAG TPA: NAD(P)/FAD-dependent oxidoreductase [Methanocorpusculum sp.]|nr:NAD(P)/FAD-dependent oxidoreductase [Methanocorpusculum sp.]